MGGTQSKVERSPALCITKQNKVNETKKLVRLRSNLRTKGTLPPVYLESSNPHGEDQRSLEDLGHGGRVVGGDCGGGTTRRGPPEVGVIPKLGPYEKGPEDGQGKGGSGGQGRLTVKDRVDEGRSRPESEQWVRGGISQEMSSTVAAAGGLASAGSPVLGQRTPSQNSGFCHGSRVNLFLVSGFSFGIGECH